MGVLSSPISSHYVSSSSSAVLSAGKVKFWTLRWVLVSAVQRGDPGPGVLHHKSLSLKCMLYSLHNISFLFSCSSAPFYAPIPAHLNKHQFICCGEMAERNHRSQCINSSDALLQTQQRKDFCNLFLGTVLVYQEWPFSLKLPVTASVPLSLQRPCKAQSQGSRVHSSQSPRPTVPTATSRSPSIATT